jgi:DNA mismatch endonuclease (patch repair protein)
MQEQELLRMSNQPPTNNSSRRCADCGSPTTYSNITENGVPYPHWYHHSSIEDAWRCGKCERNQSYHNNLPTKEQSEEIRKKRNDKRVCEDCKKPTSDIQLPWHHHTDKDGAWLCATCHQRRYYVPKKKFKTKEEQYAYLGKLFSGKGNPMYDVHINIGRTYTPERNQKVSQAVKIWAAEHPEHYQRMGTMGALAARQLGLFGLPTKLEKYMEDALKKYNIKYIPQYRYTIGLMDFYLPDVKIALFVDGAIWHADPRIYQGQDTLFFGKTAQQVWEKDTRQEGYLKSRGYTIIRFWEREVYENVDGCIKLIQKKIDDYEHKATGDQ